MLDLEFQIDTLINDEIHRETLTLSFGDGFLSQKECDENGANCTINTPGKAISEALTFHLSVGTRTLIEADEINEIISALFSQLALKAISGVGGLLGMSGKSKYSSGGSSYLDRLREDYLTKDVNSVTNGIGSGYTPTAQVFSPVDDPGVTPISAAQQAQYDALISQLAQQIASYGQLYNENGEPVDIEIPPVDPVTGEPPAGYPESVDPP